MQIANSTLSGNSAPAGFGGGIINGGAVEIRNTIFNAGALGENIVNNGGTVTSNGYNISSDDGGGVSDRSRRSDQHRSAAWSVAK